MWWIPLVASLAGGAMSQMGANQLATDRQNAGVRAMQDALDEQQEARDMALGQSLKMSDVFGDAPTAEADASNELYAKSKQDNIGDESSQSRLADLKANKSSRASADIRGRDVAGVRQAEELRDLFAPLSTTISDARRLWAMTPSRMQSAMNKVGTPGLMTAGNLLHTGGQLGSLVMGLYSGLGGVNAAGGGIAPGGYGAATGAGNTSNLLMQKYNPMRLPFTPGTGW
jgi:hypothetical protein